MDVRNLNEMPAFITKDGSEIRELLAHRNSAIRNQSLAEARVPVAGSTQEHYHPKAEEIYYITHGRGRIRIEGKRTAIFPRFASALRFPNCVSDSGENFPALRSKSSTCALKSGAR